MERKRLTIFAILLILFFTVLFLYLNFPTYKNIKILLEVNKGDTFHKIAQILLEKGIIKSHTFFLFNVKILGKSSELKTGVYEITGNLSNLEIIKILTEGKISYRIVTIPEGYNVFQIAQLLEDKGITKASEFLKYVKNEELLKKYKINSTSFEGFLFPDTYHIPYGVDSRFIIELMVRRFFEKVNDLFLKRMKELGYSLEFTIKLASLVEWEAQLDYERPIIAAVFLNRLKNNLNLASCATVLYALGNHKNRLLFKDLKKDSPYNTYIYKGLPPTPICNPSINSILATLYPAKVNYLYFVSMKNGRHYFSDTYKEHLYAYKKFILNQ